MSKDELLNFADARTYVVGQLDQLGIPSEIVNEVMEWWKFFQQFPLLDCSNAMMGLSLSLLGDQGDRQASQELHETANAMIVRLAEAADED